MSTVTRKDSIVVALDREIDKIDRLARDQGHALHPWQIDGNTAAVFCRACGMGASVRVYPTDLRVWSAGRLKQDGLKCPGKNG